MSTEIALKRLTLAILAAVALAAACEAATFSYFSYLRQTSPRSANAMRPQDGLALLARINLEVERDPSHLISRSDASAARASLDERPLNEGALRILGAFYDGQRNVRRADAAMLLADKLSRRDMLNQLWLIERSVARDDVKGAIRHYHAALSVHPELGGMLYPVLSKALAFGEVRDALRPYIASEASWMPAFIAAASTQADVRDLAAFTTPVATMLTGEHYQAAAATIIHRLAVAGKTQAALDFAGKIAPDIRRQDIAIFGLTDATRDPRLGRLSWSLSQADGVNSSVDGSGGVTVSLTPPFSGEIAARDVFVTPGRRYQFSQRIEYEGDGARPQLRWSASCANATPLIPIWEQVLPKSAPKTHELSAISAPENCSIVRFTLSAQTPDGQIVSIFNINNLSLNPF